MILRVLVHIPDVIETFASKDISGREHPRHHCVILIIVLVHAVAADEMKTWVFGLQLVPDHLYVSGVTFIVDGIRLRLSYYASIDDIVRSHQADSCSLL